MIKVLGLALFCSIAAVAIFLGITRSQPILWQMGCVILVFISLTVVAVKLFPKQLDSEESGEEGMRLVKHAVKRVMKADID
ncbi:hypothetical protein [Marinobacter adhaerens]|jgi:beta-lactamase regulating signal transducer with metallopeptidase domain|uniref:hypothetical protein n=1 Tax=Marinobacter adhaerens TaxID=1033846 RepID=UPI001E3AC27B|nr:hypothetical protein [Marinobacter adhaerens]MCD1647735.1 hypothetical protein [Marinobacter adhaerens]